MYQHKKHVLATVSMQVAFDKAQNLTRYLHIMLQNSSSRMCILVSNAILQAKSAKLHLKLVYTLKNIFYLFSFCLRQKREKVKDVFKRVGSYKVKFYFLSLLPPAAVIKSKT